VILEEQGWVSAEWAESEAHRRAKYYRLMKAGRRQVETETTNWRHIAEAMVLAIDATS